MWFDADPGPETVFRVADADVITVSRPFASVMVITTVLNEVIVDRPGDEELSPETGTSDAGSTIGTEVVSGRTCPGVVDAATEVSADGVVVVDVVPGVVVVDVDDETDAVVGAARQVDDTSP